MRQFMLEAPVGDDVYGEDPTVCELEEFAASLLGKSQGLFVASGTMGNIVSLLTHCGRGDGIIVGSASHIYNYEGGGMASLGGIIPLVVEDEKGIPQPDSVRSACRDRRNVHFVPARLLCLENTHNARGGIAVPPETFSRTAAVAREKDLAVHLDGARLFNAAVACGVDVKSYAKEVDTINICLSKGLGAPVGSVICGDDAFIERARHWRKRLGGGMRQAGIMAAGGLFALKNLKDRLVEDHSNAAWLGQRLGEAGFNVREADHGTNMVYFYLPEGIDPERFMAETRAAGVYAGLAGPGLVRAVTHLNVDREDIERAVPVFARAGGLL
jgi:threonine aldolase